MLPTDLEDKYILARWSYLIGEPLFSDIEYDHMEKEFKELYPDSIYSKQTWSFDKCPIELLTEYGYKSMIKELKLGYDAESIPSLNAWPLIYSTLPYFNEKTRLSFKIDGWNTRVSYYNGNLIGVETRGRSGNNLDIYNISTIFPKTIPAKGRVYVTGELNIPNDKWDMFKTITGNSDQRASVRTAIANDMLGYLAFCAFNYKIEDGQLNEDPYDTLTSWGFTTPGFMWITDVKQLPFAIKRMSMLNTSYNYLTDGLVLENSLFQYALRVEAWEEHNMESYVTGYEENVGIRGCSYVVNIRPIKREGKTFSRVSITNLARIIDNNLQIGAPIAFNLRSSANVVIDTTETYNLQRRWKDKWELYKKEIDSKEDDNETFS